MSRRCLGCMELFGDEFEVCPHCGYVVGTDAAEAIHMDPGTLLYDRYIIGKVLGYGGFGVTYLGWDGKLEQKVAIKEYLPGEFSTRMPGQSQVTVFNGEKNEQFHDGLKKFVEEAKHLAKFQNEPGIVKIFDSFEENETAYIIMEYLEGETLTSYLKREKTIPEDKAVEMMLPIMESLQVVHAEGLLHRDIAPDNIFLLNNGEVKLIDFGASRYATTSHSKSLSVIIKPGYSPEEQYRSRGDQGPYTDVYAIAATLYKMITGKTPPDAMERRAKYENQNKDILEEPHKINKKISPNREVAILNAMNVRIEDRTPDVLTFTKELNADPPAKRIYGKIKKLDLYHWPLWLKIAVPGLLACVVVFVSLLSTGVINFSRFTEEIVIPEGIVIVPDVEGEYTAEALKLIESGKLLATTGGTIESKYIPAGKIILQDPFGGSYMDINGTVMLTVSSGTGVVDAVDGVSVVPYIIWDDKETAIQKLEKAGLKDIVVEEVYDENVALGQVISQSIEAGTEVPEGTSLIIKVSLGAEAFPIPDVQGKPYEEAKATLEAQGLVVSIEYQKNESIPENTVIRQGTAVGSDVKRGDKITLIVSSGKNTIPVSDVIGKTENEAISILKKQGFKVTKLENYHANIPTGTVISQSPEAGTAQIAETNITIIVSKGKQPITVVFDANGGSVSKGIKTVYHTDKYGTLPTPTRAGYDFEGWYTEAVGGVKITDSATVEQISAHTLYAHWSGSSIKIILNANGGQCSESSKNVTYASEYGVLPTPTRTGYGFDGWYTEATGGNKIVNTTKVDNYSEHTLYAHWIAGGVTIIFDPNGGVCDISSFSTEYDSAYGTLPSPTRTGYTFDGWYTAINGGDKITSSSTVSVTTDQTLYAHWTAKQYTVTFNANGGKCSITTKNVSYASTYTLPTATRDYYNFTGWYTASNGGSKVSSPATMGASNITLYAHWEQKPISGWVLASEAPADAQIVDSKWTYTKTETQWSENSSISGWTFTGVTKDEVVGTGTHDYCEFPNEPNKRVYNTDDQYYKKYAHSPLTDGSTVDGYKIRITSKTEYSYIYWQWYFVSENGVPMAIDRRIGSYYGQPLSNGRTAYGWCSTEGGYVTPSTDQWEQEYFIVENVANSGSHNWHREIVYRQEYEKLRTLRQFKKVTNGLESSSAVLNGGEISNVQKYVKYCEK